MGDPKLLSFGREQVKCSHDLRQQKRGAKVEGIFQGTGEIRKKKEEQVSSPATR